MTTNEMTTAKLLLADNVSPTAVAKELGRDHKTLTSFARRRDVMEELAEMKQELADRYEELNHRLLDSIADDDIKKINVYQRVIACGVLTDNSRLLRGQSTANMSLAVLLARHVRDLPVNAGGGIETDDDIG